MTEITHKNEDNSYLGIFEVTTAFSFQENLILNLLRLPFGDLCPQLGSAYSITNDPDNWIGQIVNVNES